MIPMGYSFVYVFSDKDRDELISRGFQLLKSDENEHVYIFDLDGAKFDDEQGIVFALSNTLSF